MKFAELLLKHYNLHCISYEEITAGVSNSKYKVKTQEGDFFLKKMRHQNIDALLEEFAFTEHLHEQKIPLVLPVANKEGEKYTLYDSNMFILYPFISFDTDKTTRETAAQVGEVLGRIHTVPLNGFSQRKKGWFSMETVFKDCCKDEFLLQLLQDFYELQKVIEKSRPCIIHGDSWSTNYLFQHNTLLYVTDLEGVDVGNILHELGVAFMGHAYPGNIYSGTEIDFSYFKKLLSGYESQNPLTHFEKSHLYDAAMYGALFSLIYVYVLFNILKSKPDKDYLYENKITRYRDLQKMGADEFYKRVGID